MSAPTIRTRILGAFVLSLSAFAGSLGYGLVQLRHIGDGLAALDTGYLPLARTAAELEAVVRQMDRDHDRIAREEPRPLSGHRSNAALYSAAVHDAVEQGLLTLEGAQAQLTDTDEQQALSSLALVLSDIDARRAAYEEAFGRWLDASSHSADEGHRPEDRRAQAALDTRRAELLLQVGHLSDLVEGRIQTVSAATARAQGRAYTGSGALAALATLLSGAMAAVALFSLRPIGLLTAQVQRLAAGQTAGRLDVGGTGELSLLAREFNTMAEAVSERDRRLTERARALDHLSLRLRRVLDTIHAGLVVVEEGVAAMSNPAAARLWGVKEGAPLPPLLASLSPGRADSLPDGDRRFDVEVVPFGERGALIVGEDVTERLRDQDRLARSERLAVVGQMLAQITHEVRNPLNAMSLHAELLTEELKEGEHRDMLAIITAQIRRLEALTGRYLELSRGRRPELGLADPLEISRELLRLEEEALRRAGVRAAVEGRVGVVEIDAEALRRTLHNLIRNAMEAGATSLRIHHRREADRVYIDVHDDGPGLGADEARRAFEPFYTTKAYGTGLGLAISRQEIEDVGGTLSCESSPGQGSTFHLELPLGEGP